MFVRFVELLLELVDAVQIERRIGGITRSETALDALIIQRGDWPPAQRTAVAAAITNAVRRFLAAGAPSAAVKPLISATTTLLTEQHIHPAEEIASALVRALDMRARQSSSPPSDKETRAWNVMRAEVMNAAGRYTVNTT